MNGMIQFENPLIKELLEKYETLRAVMYLYGLSGWEMRTYMPPAAAEYRAKAWGKISVLLQRLSTDNEFIACFEKAKKEDGLNDAEKGVLRMVGRMLDEYLKLPASFLEQWGEITGKGDLSRQKAKQASDFSLFEGDLQQIIHLIQEKVSILGYTNHPYDVLLDQYEEGLTTATLDEYFGNLKGELLEIMNNVQSSFLQPTKFRHYDKSQLEKINRKILEYLGFDEHVCRIDVSAHPFSTGFSTKDTRITTAFRDDFEFTISSSIHELGHNLYELGSDEKLDMTPVSGGTSLIIHESQSRFWENFVGRSLTFCELFLEDFRSLGEEFKTLTAQELYQHFNHVEPSFIRIEADEITYHFHILIRFEIEKALANKEIEVKDIPTVWNAKYKEYLGIDVPSDAKGCLQDMHWSDGTFGYFPTYSLGTALSAIWKEKLEKELGAVNELIRTKEGVLRIRAWLREHIHQYGSIYTLDQLLEKEGLQFSPDALIRYLKTKFY